MDRRAFLLTGSLLAAGAAANAEAGAGATTFAADAHVVLRAYQALVEQHLTDILSAIRALAATSDARTGSWPSIEPALGRFSKDLSTAATVWFAQPDGRYASTEGVSAGASLADRDYFPELMAGRDVVGRLVISKSTGHRSIIVATPVSRDGRVVAAIGVSIKARMASELVANRIRLPRDLIFYALDQKGQTAIHLDAQRMFQYPAEIGDASLKAAVGTILSRPEGSVEYTFAGAFRTAIFEKSDLTGWRFVLVQVHS